jgi:hypothetical protein
MNSNEAALPRVRAYRYEGEFTTVKKKRKSNHEKSN